VEPQSSTFDGRSTVERADQTEPTTLSDHLPRADDLPAASVRPSMTRRRVLGGVVVAGAAAPVLAACADPSSTTSDEPAAGDPPAEEKPAEGDPAEEEQPSDDAPDDGASADELAKAGDISVGGGKVNEAAKVVVTQPEQGTFKAFSAVCTHNGCLVNAVESGTIKCPCHGSMFSAADGSVTGGPAGSPLEEKQINVDGDSITLA
jgi:Rieske Fe-S protein